MQNLATFEAMTAVTLQFLQHNAQYQAGVTVTPNNRRGPGKEKAKARERAKLMDQRRVASYADVLATWPKIAGSRTQARAAHPTTRATFSTRGGVLWHEEAGEIAVDRVRNHCEMECWIKPGNVLAPVQIGGSSGSAGEPAGHHVAVPQRTDAGILMDAQPQEAYAPRADEEHIEPEILPVASLPGPREPSKDEIEKHNVLHDPAMPWCDICIQSKSRDDFHRQTRPKVLPVIQFDYAVAGTHQGQPHFDFMVGTDMSTGAAWASTVLIKGKEDPYIVSSILSWLSELGHSKIIIQSDGEPASEVVMRMVQSEGAMMEHPPCEIIQQ